MQIFANLLRFWLIGLIRTAEALICGKCENGFEAIPNIFVTKDSALAGCVKHSSHECQSNDVCLVETIRRKDSTDRWTVISGCQPKGQHFIKNFCVYKDLPQGEFYRCRCDTDNCNAHTTDVLQVGFHYYTELKL